jgi:cell wall-associated NlpC family hydrolase
MAQAEARVSLEREVEAVPQRNGEPRIARSFSRLLVVGSVGLAALVGITGTGAAVPPPPPNPSDSEINAGRAQANARAGEVGQLTNQLAEAEGRLSTLQDDVELKMEEANKALVDMQSAQDAAGQARLDAEGARQESDAAAGDIERARQNMDRFIAGSYQQGSTIGSMSAYLGSRSPKDLLARAQMLNAVSGSQLNAMQVMQRAQTEKANKDSAARKAVELAEQKQELAEQAKGSADAAQATAEHAQQSQQSNANQLQADKSDVERRLYDAQQQVAGLQGQRQRYEDWVAQKQREDDDRARQAAMAAASSGSDNSGNDAPSPGRAQRRPSPAAGSGIESVIARAMSVLGMPYAWGGGNGSGPTRGIRDGGVADSYGDYRKIGFDCSGLMIYSFAGVTSLSHYSGYQYTAGRHVPLSQMRRGDMLFYGGGGGIHHVALYLGNGMMIEAPESGSVVKISTVRYGGIMPYATRLIG